MQDKKLDRRVKYTKQALKDSLIELLQEKAIEKITVKELCEKADVNRGTFYSHYTDQFELYDEVVREFLEGCVSFTGGIFMPFAHDRIKATASVYRYVKENKDLAKVLLNGRSVFGFDRYNDTFNEIVHTVYLDEIKKNVPNVRFVDMVYQFVAIGNITLIKYWINTGMKETEEEMAVLALKLTMNGVNALNNQ